MLIKTKKERFYYQNREKLTMLIFATVALIFSILGYRSAFNENLAGCVDFGNNFCFFWNCFCVPLIMAITPIFVKDDEKMLITVMCLKVAVTLIGLLFGANPNIYLPVFQDDWGVLFFVAVDIFVAATIYSERNQRMLIKGIGTVILAFMVASQIIGFIEGNFVPYFFFRSVYVFLFYRSIYAIVRHITPNWRPFPNSHEMKKIEKRFTKEKEDTK